MVSGAEFFQHIRLGDKIIDGRLVIPSGIRCTKGSTIEKVLREVKPVGIVTTKSISAFPKEGYREPIYARYCDGSYINAVGLDNPGAMHFQDELTKINVPANKFLLVSIFGGNAAEFVKAACILETVADGFELNMSCPHAEGYGIEIGHDLELVREITRAVVRRTSRPVFIKLPATCRDIGKTAKTAMDVGATGITTINTVGPAMHFLSGQPILHNRIGGLSGDGIRPLGLSSVRRIRDVLGPGPLIIGMGGISDAEHIRDYYSAGADFFGIGSALTGMSFREMKLYIHALQKDLLTNRSLACADRKEHEGVNMAYSRCRLAKKVYLSDNLFKIYVDDLQGFFDKQETAGRFYFLCILGVGEKPFAVFSQAEKSFIIKRVGFFTRYLAELPEGSEIWIRGPHGVVLPRFSNSTIALVGGGTGIVPLFEIARKYSRSNKVLFFLGGRNKQDLLELNKFEALGEVHVATDDGSLGFRGYVSDLIARELAQLELGNRVVFMNSGPEEMVLKCFAVETAYTLKSHIWGAIPYRTCCGVGICGQCSTPSGLLSCVNGPFLPMKFF